MTLLVLVAVAFAGDVLFEPNRGQAAKDVRYLARAAGQVIHFTDSGVVLHQRGGPVRLTFPGASGPARWLPESALTETISYFKGASGWLANLPRFRRVVWPEVYPHVDAVFYGAANRLEYDLILKAGADPAGVRLRFQGAPAEIRDDGRIVAGSVRQRSPYIYQKAGRERRLISGGFVRTAAPGEFRLRLGAYEPANPVVVDPVIESLEYQGGEDDDRIVAAGDDFLAGTTASIAFPTGGVKRSGRDIFLRNASGTVVIGGSGDDDLTGVIALSATSFLIAGSTNSVDFPSGLNDYTLLFRGGATDGFAAIVEILPATVFRSSLVRLRAILTGGAGRDEIRGIGLIDSGHFAAAGATDSPDFVELQAGGSRLSGGVDAFAAIFEFNTAFIAAAPYPISILSGTYLGGGQKEEATSVAVGQDQRIYVAGSTASSDFPAQSGERRGGSDGFLAAFEKMAPNTWALREARLIGGSGDDRIEALTASAESLALTGATTSPDFPLLRPVQARLAGPSDAFAMQFSIREQSLRFSTYLGGTGAETGTAVAMNGAGDLYLAGDTDSADLAVLDAVQSTPGGMTDGFAAVIDNGHTLRTLTYFGGAGNDRVRHLSLRGNSPRIAGETSSADLPQPASAKSFWYERADGFVAILPATHIVGPGHIFLGENMVANFSLQAGDRPDAIVTLRTPDTAKAGLGESGQAVEVPGPQIRLVANASSGEVDLVATAPGSQPKTIRLTLFPSVLAYEAQSPLVLAQGSQLALRPKVGALNAAENRIETTGQLRADLPPVRWRWRSSDEVVARFDPEDLLVALNPGTAQLSLTSPDLPVYPATPLELSVRPRRFQLPDEITLGKDLQTALSLSTSATVRSADPARLLISRDASQAGSGSATGSSLFLQALSASGDVDLIITADQHEEHRIKVRLMRAEVLPVPPTPAFRLLAGATAQIDLRVRPEGTQGPGYTLRPGLASPPFQISSSDPLIARPAPFLSGATASITGVAPGSAIIRVTSRLPDMRVAGELTVKVEAPLLIPARFLVGKDLVERFESILPPAFDGADVEFEIEDSALALVSAQATTAGAKRVRAKVALNRLTFFLQGLRPSGQTTLSIRLPGGLETSAAVVLLPSGFAFERALYAGDTLNPPAVQLAGYALDPVTSAPLRPQAQRPGVSARPELSLQGSSAVGPSFLFNSSSPFAVVGLTPRGTGDTTVSVRQPEGFSPPATRVSTVVRLFPGVIRVARPPVAVRDFVTRILVPYDQEFSATSMDPSKLLLSANGTDGGAASVRFRTELYLYGMSAGEATLRFAGLISQGETTVTIEDPRFRLTGPAAGELLLGAPPSVWGLSISSPNSDTVIVRRDLGVIRVRVTSSNPLVAQVRPEFLEFERNGESRRVELTAISAGATEIRFDAPYRMDVAPVAVTVRRPSIRIESFSPLGKDTQRPLNVFLEAPLLGSSITVTSRNPDRVLLSTDRSVAGSASVTVRPTDFVWVQALTDAGEATLTISAPGHSDQQISVPLVPTSVAYLYRPPPLLPLGQPRPAALTLTPGDPLRLGVSLRVSLTSEDPAVLTVSPTSVVFGPGQGSADFEILPHKEGRSRITLDVPAGFGAPPFSDRSVLVQVTRTAAGGCAEFVASRALAGCEFTGLAQFPVMVTSLDPSKLLIQYPDSRAGGTERVVIPPGPRIRFTLIPLAADGIAAVAVQTFASPELRFPVTLLPSALVWQDQRKILLRVGETRDLNLMPAMLFPDGGIRFAGLRDETTVARLISSRPQIVSVDESVAITTRAKITARAPGVATVTIAPPAGFLSAPAATLQVEVTPN